MERSSIAHPRLSLKLLFLWMFFLAFGLAVGAPAVPIDEDLAALGYYIPRLHWYMGLLAVVAAAMVWGLVHEIIMLGRYRVSITGDQNQTRAISWAIAWRVALVTLLTISSIAVLLERRGLIQLPEREWLWLTDVAFPGHVWTMCIAAVLNFSVHRWAPARVVAPTRGWMFVAIWIATIVIIWRVMIDRTIILYLVHVAMAGIEYGIRAPWQRTGTFPNLEAEGFRTYWIALAAACGVFASGMSLTWLLYARPNRWMIRCTAMSAIACLWSAAVVFCVWYYGTEFHRLSPDMASVGLTATWADWLGGAMLVLLAACVAGFRWAKVESVTLDHRHASLQSWPRPRLHETAIGLAVTVAAILWYLGQEIASAVQPAFGVPLWNNLLWMLCDIDNTFNLVICVLGVQLCWRRWRNRDLQLQARFDVVNPRRFVFNTVALALLTIIALPTLAAYFFVYWLGPWYLK